MKVKELIAFLQTQPQEIEVAYDKYSDCCLMQQKEIRMLLLPPARSDGWIEYRSAEDHRPYLVFPGN